MDQLMTRFLVCAALALGLAHSGPAFAEPTSPGRIEFEVLRNGQPFGRQAVVVRRAGGGFIAETSAELEARVGPVRLFSYEHRCREAWSNGRLQELSCSTSKNGRRSAVAGAAGDEGFFVLQPQAAVFATDVMPTSWWRRPPLSTREMLNTETGESLPVRVFVVGRERITIGGRAIMAERIRVQGTHTLDLWYDEAGRWVNSAFTIDGQSMTYRLLTPPSDAPH